MTSEAKGAQVSAVLADCSAMKRGGVPIDNSILCSVALQPWARYRTPALAVRAADTTLAKGAAPPLHVLCVSEHERSPERGPHDMASRHRDDMRQRTDNLRERRMDDFIAPRNENTLAGRQPAGGYGADGS